MSLEEIIATPTERFGTGQFDVTICQWLICDVNIWQALVLLDRLILTFFTVYSYGKAGIV